MMNLKKLSARYLLTLTTDQLWECLIGRFILVFDDGELITDYKKTLYSSYLWRLFREFPNAPFQIQHHVQSVVSNSVFTSGTHNDLLTNIYWSIADHYQLTTPESRDYLTWLTYQSVNDLYNDLQIRCEAYVSSIDILDFIGVHNHPRVKAMMENPKYTEEYINECYTVIKDVIHNDPLMDNNALAKATRFKMVKENQVLQCVGPRGKVSEVDSAVMAVPVMRSYTQGMRSLYDVAAESRAAAKSYYFADATLKDSEYFSRRLQILTMQVEHLYVSDCGSTEYIPWRVKPPVVEDNQLVYAGDLKFLVGKYYLDEESNTLKIISKKDKHLNNTTVKLRSVLTCKHPDKKGVCSVCFGQMSDNIMPNANLGHHCATIMARQISQSLLSAKHLIVSAIVMTAVLSEEGKRVFFIDSSNVNYFLRPEFIGSDIELVVPQEDVFGLVDILNVKSVKDLNPSRVSKLDYFTVNVPSKNISIPLGIGQKGNHPMFTTEFLEYLRIHRWTLSTRGDFIFNFKNWDFSKPVIKLTEMEFSYAKNREDIAKVIESKVSELDERLNPESPLYTLVELFDLVNYKLSVNLALLEVVIYASMVKNGHDYDYGLSRFSDAASIGVSQITLRYRSLSAAYAYKEQHTRMVSPDSFFKLGRQDNVFDAFFDPQAVIKHLNK